MTQSQIQEKLSKKEFTRTNIKQNEIIQSQVKDLLLLTINHKTAPVPIREKFAIPDYKLTEASELLKAYKSLKSFLVLSTCNRTEIFFTSNDYEKAIAELFSFFNSYLGLEQKIVKEYNQILKDNDVIHHAFMLGSGLDSLVVGESQVLSQVKNAYSTAQKEKTLDKKLELLFQEVIKTAKEVHKKTNLSKNSQSISSAAIELADKVCGPLKTKSIMVLGAGKMAKLALEHINKIGGSKETVVLNRSPHRVIEFSEKYKIDKSFPFENIYEELNNTDIVICSAGAPHFIIFAEEFKKTREDFTKPLHIFDITMPRNIDSEFGKLDNVKLFDIDSLQEIYNKTIHVQKEDLQQAKEIISNGINKFYRQIENEKTDEFIKELKEKFEKIRKEKLSALQNGKTTFTKEEVDYITKNVVNTIAHEQIKDLKNVNL